MNLSAHISMTPFPPSFFDGTFADAKRESASRLASGVERSNIDYSLKMSEILSSSMRPNDNHLSHEWDAVGRPYSSTELRYSSISHAHFVSQTRRLHSTGLVYSVLQHEEGLVSAFPVEDVYPEGRLYELYELVNKFNEFPGYSPPTELASFEELMDALQMRGFNESVEEIEALRSADDLEPGDKPLLLESVRGFVNLMDAFHDLGEPMVGRFSAGTLSVEWRIADDKLLLVEPLDSGNASFALIGPSLTPGADEFRLNGRGKIADVVDAMRNNQVDKWRVR